MIRVAILVATSMVVAGCSGDGSTPAQPSADGGTSSSSGGTSSSSSSGGTTSSSSSSGSPTGCTLAEATTPTSKVSDLGCAVLTRDTSACKSAREAAGLAGFWLKFSCRVNLSVVGNDVVATSDNRPDYTSNYFPSNDPCHETFTKTKQNPNTIASKSLEVHFPKTPSSSGQKMSTAIVGLALNGVAVFGNFAAPGDDIFREAETFDRCSAHPQMQGVYHYHSEPTSITNADSSFVGVMRDGYPIYGRNDADGSLPTNLDANGGHTSATPDSATPTYHYHVNEQTSTSPGTTGEKQWFLTKGTYYGAPGACTGCN